MAFFQPASESATYEQEDIQYGAALAVDDKSSTYAYTYTSGSSTPAWWQVDLGGLASVSSVWLLQPYSPPNFCCSYSTPKIVCCVYSGRDRFMTFMNLIKISTKLDFRKGTLNHVAGWFSKNQQNQGF